jgi:hypothetical protein
MRVPGWQKLPNIRSVIDDIICNDARPDTAVLSRDGVIAVNSMLCASVPLW